MRQCIPESQTNGRVSTELDCFKCWTKMQISSQGSCTSYNLKFQFSPGPAQALPPNTLAFAIFQS